MRSMPRDTAVTESASWLGENSVFDTAIFPSREALSADTRLPTPFVYRCIEAKGDASSEVEGQRPRSSPQGRSHYIQSPGLPDSLTETETADSDPTSSFGVATSAPSCAPCPHAA